MLRVNIKLYAVTLLINSTCSESWFNFPTVYLFVLWCIEME